MSKKLQLSNQQEIQKFLQRAKQDQAPVIAGEIPRLLFALDATGSRQPTWDLASHYQAEMFDVLKTQKLAVQLVYYRGQRDFKSSPWLQSADKLKQQMLTVQCLAGRTQISRVLNQAVTQCQKGKLNAVVFIGDALEEPVQPLFNLAGQLKLYNAPVFMFQEGANQTTQRAFFEIAQLSGGAYAQFNARSAMQLKALLAAVSLYTQGGKQAMQQLHAADQKQISALLNQLKD